MQEAKSIEHRTSPGGEQRRNRRGARFSGIVAIVFPSGSSPHRDASCRSSLMGLWPVLGLGLALLLPSSLWAVSCTLQGEMTPQVRSSMEQSARTLAQQIAAGNAAQVRTLTIPSVAAQFQSIAGSIQRLAPLITGATITIDAMYSLDATDLKQTQQADFFCAAPNSNLQEEVGIPALPPGAYGLVLVHATGVKTPQQMGLILQRSEGGQWLLAGFFSKPLDVAGHDSVWYWSRARQFAQKGQTWNAHFYYGIAANLALPVEFLSTPNLRKLLEEQSAVRATGLPGATTPLVLNHNGQSYTITGLRTDSSLGGLDLVVQFSVADVSDPVATRTRILGLMSAMLAQYPQLRDAFHGLWVFADAPGQRPFAIEQPMNAIP